MRRTTRPQQPRQPTVPRPTPTLATVSSLLDEDGTITLAEWHRLHDGEHPLHVVRQHRLVEPQAA